MLNIKKTKTSYIAYTAIFTAICFAINYIYIPIGAIFAISFVPTVCFLAGILLNPFLAFVVGGLADILGCFAQGYPPNVFITLGSSLWGVFMGLSYRYLKFPRLVKMIIGSAIAVIVCSFFLNSYGLYTYTTKGTPFFLYAFTRFPVQLLNTIANVIVTFFVVRALERANLNKPKE